MRELFGPELGDGFFDVFELGHAALIAQMDLPVMAGLDPAIHLAKKMDARVKPAHDDIAMVERKKDAKIAKRVRPADAA